jgi:hypothetical protein
MISEPEISLNCPLSAFFLAGEAVWAKTAAFFGVKKAWNPAWRQALLGRPAIAGCSPMLPRCGTNASLISQQPSAVGSRPPITIHDSRFTFPICVHLRPSVVKKLWDFVCLLL